VLVCTQDLNFTRYLLKLCGVFIKLCGVFYGLFQPSAIT